METNTKVAGISFLILIGFALLTPSNEPNYYCEDREARAYCEGFSKYYGLPNGKCLNSIDGNKLCRSEWEEIGAIEIVEPVTPEPATRSSVEGVWHCESGGCK